MRAGALKPKRPQMEALRECPELVAAAPTGRLSEQQSPDGPAPAPRSSCSLHRPPECARATLLLRTQAASRLHLDCAKISFISVYL